MTRLTSRIPRFVHPRLPNAMVQQLDAVAEGFDLPRNHLARIILRETLADLSRRDAILAEIQHQRAHRLYGDSTGVLTWMDDETSLDFADLMATTGARATQVARAIITVGCASGLSRFKKWFIAASVRRDEVEERQREKILNAAFRHGLDLKVRA